LKFEGKKPFFSFTVPVVPDDVQCLCSSSNAEHCQSRMTSDLAEHSDSRKGKAML